MKREASPRVALWRFGFRQTKKGALIVGVLVGLMVVGQGFGYTATYPDKKSQEQFAASLQSAPSLGVLYGEPKNLVSASGYVVYRTVAVMGLIVSIWGIVVATKLLRGQEEDGHWELIAASNTTRRGGAKQLVLGFATSLGLAFAITAALAVLGGTSSDMSMSFWTSCLIALAIYLPAAVFIGLGILVSQLSVSRRRALMYGMVPLLVFFALRALGNTIPDLYWLKNLTPFGWSDMISPVVNPHAAWLIPGMLLALALTVWGVYLVGKRDMGEGLLKESATTKPHYFLLGSAGRLALRQNLVSFVGWGIGALVLSLIMGAITGIAASSLVDSPAAQDIVLKLGGSANDVKVAMLGAGFILTTMAILIMVTTSIANIRHTEAKNYLDNILVQPVRRSSWLIIRLLTIIATFTFISVICGLATWLLADAQGISLHLGNLLLVSLALTGTLIFTLGFGTLLYGLAPRLAVIGMYVIVGWSFVVDVMGSAIKLNNVVTDSSLFHYVSVSPAAPPDWKTFAWLAGLGLAMAVIGIVSFTRRDIIAE